ncbi:MAG: DUF3352 domain-containing protein [bacterium]|nr:DUF3352 domain-containing protein [bacterium]
MKTILKQRINTLFLLCAFVLVLPAVADNKIPYEEWLPADTAFFLTYNSSHASAQAFPHFKKGMVQLADSLNDILEYRMGREILALNREKLGIDETFSCLLGDQAVFAVVGLDPTATKIPSVLYLSQVPDRQKADAFLSLVFQATAAWIPQIQVEEDEYQGLLIRSLHGPGMIPGLGLSYAFHDSMLILSTSKPSIIRLFDEYSYEENRLATNPIYQQALSPLPENRWATVYFNFTTLTETFNQVLEMVKLFQGIKGQENEDLKTMLETLPALATVQSYTMGVYPPQQDDFLRLVGHTLFKESQTESPFAFLKREPSSFRFESYLPRKTGSFTSGNVYSLNDIWTLAQTLLPAVPGGKELIQPLAHSEEILGVSIETDLLSWMGDEWCFVRPVMDLEAVVPVNRAAYLVRVKDRANAQQGLQKVIQAIKEKSPVPLTIEAETFKGIELFSVRLPIPVVPLIPSWCLMEDDTFILASHIDLLREMVDIHAGGRTGIARNPSYRQLQQTLETPGNKHGFQDIYSEFYTYREAIRRVASVFEQTAGGKSQVNFPAMVLMDRGSHLLRNLQVLRGTTKVSASQGNGVVTTKTMLVKDLDTDPSLLPFVHYKVALQPEVTLPFITRYTETLSATEAIRCYRILADFYPDQAEYLHKLTKLYQEVGQTAQAVECIEQALLAMPNTALVIEKERVRNQGAVADLIQAVKAEAQKSRRVKPDFAYFGLALSKRDAGQLEFVAPLFDAIHNEFPSSPLVPAVVRELALLKNEIPESAVRIGHPSAPIVVDGHLDEAVWQEGQAYALAAPAEIQASSWEASVWFAAEESALYVALRGKGPLDPVLFTLSLCPGRDYTNVTYFSLQVTAQERDMQSQPAWRFEQQHLLELALESSASLPLEDQAWTHAMAMDESGWSLEMAIPWKAVMARPDGPQKGVLLQFALSKGTEEQNQPFLWLNPMGTPQDVLSYRVGLLD